MSLETRLKACHKAKQQLEERFDDLAEELADVEHENDILKRQPSNTESTVANSEIIDQLQQRIRIQDEQLQFAELDNQLLRQKLQTVGTSGQPSNIESTVANSETIDQLQGKVMSLETSLKISRKEKKELEQILEKLVKELADVKRETDILKDRQQLQPTGNFVQPDYEATRDHALAKLKMGKQSTAGKAIDAFIKELKHGL